MCASTKLNPAPSSGGSRKNIWGAWPLIIWEATTAKRNYYRTNYWCIAKKLDGYTLETWRRAASAERWKREDWGAERHGVLGGHPLPSWLGDLGSVVSSPAGSGAKPRPPTHSRHISGPQKPSSRNNALWNQSKIWGPGQDLGACAPLAPA